MKDLYIQSIFNQYLGKRDEALADLNVYLDNPVGVGEHPNIGEEIRRKIEEVDKYTSLVETMKGIFERQQNLPPETPKQG